MIYTAFGWLSLAWLDWEWRDWVVFFWKFVVVFGKPES